MPLFDEEQDPFGGIKNDRRKDVPAPREVSTFHTDSDVDSSIFAHHHTLGGNHNQAAPGDHTHNGRDSKPLAGNVIGSDLGQFQFVLQQNDLIRNNTNVIVPTDLSLPVAANSKYIVEAYLRGMASITGKWKTMFSTPAGSTMSWSTGSLQNGANATSGDLQAASSAAGSTVAYAGAGVAVEVTARLLGLLVTGGTAGALLINFGQNTAEATDSTLKVNSWMRIQKVA